MGTSILVRNADFSKSAICKKNLDSGYINANCLADGQIVPVNVLYKSMMSTYMRRVARGSYVTISTRSAYPAGVIMVKVLEYDVGKNFIRRIHDAQFASQSADYKYDFRVTDKTAYIRICIEATRENEMGKTITTYNALHLTGSKDGFFAAGSLGQMV